MSRRLRLTRQPFITEVVSKSPGGSMRLTQLLPFALLTVACGFAIGVGCSDDAVDGATTTNASSGTSTGGAGSGGGSSSSYTTSTGPAPTHTADCQGHYYECGDLVDNEGDGLVDSQDPDCLGPCDDTEGSYYGGIPGQSGPACIVDCYFDQDSGPGNDDCYWNHQCDPNEVAPNYYPESFNGAQCEYDTSANTPGTGASCDELYQTQSQTCLDYCGPLTPNGCDCFGCCELPAGSGSFVWLGSDADGTKEGSCDRDSVSDPSRCEPCLPVAACLNGCAPCELCIGKEVLPPECYENDAGTPQQCSDGVQPCGLAGQEPCAAGYSCITGCCIATPD
jgi:hypothetical protein